MWHMGLWSWCNSTSMDFGKLSAWLWTGHFCHVYWHIYSYFSLIVKQLDEKCYIFILIYNKLLWTIGRASLSYWHMLSYSIVLLYRWNNTVCLSMVYYTIGSCELFRGGTLNISWLCWYLVMSSYKTKTLKQSIIFHIMEIYWIWKFMNWNKYKRKQ